MIMKKYILLVVLTALAFSQLCKSQSLDSTTIDKIKNEDLPYTDEHGVSLNQRFAESYSVKVVFYSFMLDKVTRRAKIKGRVIEPGDMTDTTGERNYIFLATPKKNKLTRLRSLGTSYARLTSDAHLDKFPFRSGDFDIEFTFNKKERLYFNGEMTFLVEYNIGMLLQQ